MSAPGWPSNSTRTDRSSSAVPTPSMKNPAIGAFLDLLAADIRAGGHVRAIPDDLAQSMIEHAQREAGAGGRYRRGHRRHRRPLMQRHGWTLLFHDCLIDQLRKLHSAVQRAQRNDPAGFASNANVKLFHALSRLMLEVIPAGSVPGTSTVRAVRSARATAIGGAPGSADGFDCSSAMTRGRR